MDYRVFNVRTFLCLRVHTGVGRHTDKESAHHFDSEKNSQKCFVCSRRDSNLWSWNALDLEADALTLIYVCVVLSNYRSSATEVLWELMSSLLPRTCISTDAFKTCASEFIS